ncbi:MAG: RluA family pseudouridine synthase [Clostridia bacterium]|nr:RluA family pseudouridine synthase [Clostridia bacterium]
MLFIRELEFTVGEQCDGMKAQTFLRSVCHLSYKLVVRLKRVENGITENGRHIRTIDRLTAGSVVRVRLPEDDISVEPYDMPLDIVFEDEDILVIDKPAGMAVHPSPGHDTATLANAVSAYFLRQGKTLGFRPIYRLDKDTSGLILIAKNTFCASRLGKNVQKRYYAVAQGEIKETGTLDLPIIIAPGHSIQRSVGEGGISAVTHYVPLCVHEGNTLLEIELETGRTHQIRVHFSHIGHPLAGDDMYGGKRDIINRQALHCGKLWFTHPVTGEEMKFNCPLPEDIKKITGGYEI